jgi:hypothetical protein
MTILSEHIERLRQEMYRAAELYGMHHPKVLEASKCLDELINVYYQSVKRKRKLTLPQVS